MNAPQSLRAVYTRQLDEVNAAISDLTGGARSASVSAGGAANSYSNHPLPDLMKLRDDLLAKIAALRTGGRPTVRYPHYA